MLINHDLRSCHSEHTGITIMTSSKTLIYSSIMAALLSGNALADEARAPGYLFDTGGTIVRSDYNECWHTGHWTSEMSIAECDPYMVAKHAQAEEMHEEVVAPVPEQLVTPEPEPEQETMAPAQPAPSQDSEAVTPVPVAVPAQTPKKVTQKRISFSAETLMEFNKFTLRAEGRNELDGLIQELKGMDFDTVDVTGHSDRIGSAKFNQRLSEQRAYAVRDYLVSKSIPANKIVVAGKGETQPVTLASTCAGPKSKKLIACLQPDRRVDVEVTATK